MPVSRYLSPDGEAWDVKLRGRTHAIGRAGTFVCAADVSVMAVSLL
jgi:hypothetical protein